MTTKRIRNRGCMPYLQTEGVFERAPPIEVQKAEAICTSWSPFIRLYRHNTLASARKNFLFKPFSDQAPQDQLDFVLSSTFDQSIEFFPDQLDVYLQRETQDIETWRRLRNTRDLTPDREEQASQANKAGDHGEDGGGGAGDSKGKPPKKKQSSSKKGIRPVVKLPFRYNFAKKLLVGGITERRHPSNIKLMNSSHHSPQTNAGYSRQPSDGNFYQY